MARSYVLELLRILAKHRDSGNRKLDTQEIHSQLSASLSDDLASFIPNIERLTEVLAELNDIAIFSGNSEERFFVVENTVNDTGSPPPSPPPPGDNDLSNGDGDGDDGEGGLNEVIKHKLLFTYSEADFDQLLLQVLELT